MVAEDVLEDTQHRARRLVFPWCLSLDSSEDEFFFILSLNHKEVVIGVKEGQGHADGEDQFSLGRVQVHRQQEEGGEQNLYARELHICHGSDFFHCDRFRLRAAMTAFARASVDRRVNWRRRVLAILFTAFFLALFARPVFLFFRMTNLMLERRTF